MTNKLTAILKGCRLLDRAFSYIKPRLIPGKTEKQIKNQLNIWLKKAGAQGFAFPTIVAFGNHTANIHHRPGNRRLTNNQIVMIDIGVKISGYCSDITRMFFIGKPKKDWIKIYNLVLKSQEKAISLLRQKKVAAAEIDAASRKFFPIPHAVGHGLGKVIHDKPKINPRSRFLIKPGDIFTIEPGRYFPGRFGIRIEDSVLKTKTGYRLLTNFPKSTNVILT